MKVSDLLGLVEWPQRGSGHCSLYTVHLYTSTCIDTVLCNALLPRLARYARASHQRSAGQQAEPAQRRCSRGLLRGQRRERERERSCVSRHPSECTATSPHHAGIARGHVTWSLRRIGRIDALLHRRPQRLLAQLSSHALRALRTGCHVRPGRPRLD